MKKFDIRKTFEIFLKEPLSILTEGLFQIVNVNTSSFNESPKTVKMWGKTLEMKIKKKNAENVNVDFVAGKTQITVVNNERMYNLFQTVMYKQKLKKQKLGLTK